MSFYLRKEWIEQVDDIERVFIRYAVAPLGALPAWDNSSQSREMYPESNGGRKRRAKVIKLPRNLQGLEHYNFHYKFQVWGAHEWETQTYAEEIVSDDHIKFVDHTGQYTNICVYWSLNGWGAANYSTMFEDGTSLDHELSSLHLYGRAHDGAFIYQRYAMLQAMPLPHIYRGKVHGPRGSRVDFCFHIMRRGSPDGHDYDFWDNNEGLNYSLDIR